MLYMHHVDMLQSVHNVTSLFLLGSHGNRFNQRERDYGNVHKMPSNLYSRQVVGYYIIEAVKLILFINNNILTYTQIV